MKKKLNFKKSGVGGDIVVNGGGDIADSAGEVGKIITAGHDTDQIGVFGEVDDATVMKLFLAGGKILSFTEFVGNNYPGREVGD